MGTDAAGGTYTLVIELPEPADIEVGALGEITFDAGWYAYVGSALGSGGFARIDRHRELAAGDRDTRHWHIDYLLGQPTSRLDTVVTTAGVDGECTVARELGDGAVPAFGCSDCRCDSHLFAESDRAEIVTTVEAAHERIR
ncbi:MAG: GIY-YIG nuclease family protein [Halovenus sp.]